MQFFFCLEDARVNIPLRKFCFRKQYCLRLGYQFVETFLMPVHMTL